MKHLKHGHFLCMKYTALDESLVTYSAQLCLMLYLPLNSHLKMYISYRLAAII